MSRGDSVEIASLETPCLGNRSYIAFADGEAAVIDPPRDIDRVEELVERANARIRLVAETHRHADYVSGGLELARRHRASYLVPPGDPEPRFRFAAALDGRSFGTAAIGGRVLATPGHTPHHVSYEIEN